MSQHPSLEPSLAPTPEQLSTLLDCAHEMLMILGADGIVLHANAGSSHALGVRPEELLGRNLKEFVHPDEMNEIGDELRGAADVSNGTGKRRCRLRNKTGEWRWFEANISNCLRNTAVDGMVASFLDVKLSRKLFTRLIRRPTWTSCWTAYIRR
jgi:PAS domain S-box-containing protein